MHDASTPARNLFILSFLSMHARWYRISGSIGEWMCCIYSAVPFSAVRHSIQDQIERAQYILGSVSSVAAVADRSICYVWKEYRYGIGMQVKVCFAYNFSSITLDSRMR
jgi:hypothetical protein